VFDPGRHGYARAADGTYVAYEVVEGDGPLTLVWQLDFFGCLDVVWEVPFLRDWLNGLAGFSRLILHDRRGTGLSSRDVSAPNLETRVSDLIAVLEATGASDPVVLAAQFEGGAPNVLFAGAYPERVRSMVWLGPMARSTWAPDYPWGAQEEDVEAERRALAVWGTADYGPRFLEAAAVGGMHPDPGLAGVISKASRLKCTPDMAAALSTVWHQSDVRGALPAVQASALLVTTPRGSEEAEYVASLMQHASIAQIDGDAPGSEQLELVRRFLQVEPTPVSLDTILATVLFTDIVGSTTRQATLGDREWKALVEQHNAIVRRALQKWHGRENDTAGDGFYATFDGPARAIQCALEISDQIRDLGIEIRAGIHTGECEVIDGKCAGIAVTTGSRIGAMAQPSQVLVSQTVRDLVAGSGLTFKPAGEHELKGVPDTWRVYLATR
jgi:class 3 adenylate cyclase/pimeloyl-ACP methyl ester carboxylesterase